MTRPLLDDRVILVTGAATGIGEAIARRAHEEGAHVMLHDRNAEVVQHARELGGRASSIVADLADEETPRVLIDAVVRHFGRIDALVNNAALTTRSNISGTDAAHFDLMMKVNVRAPLLLIKEARPHFMRQRRGVVVNVGSVNAYCGEPNLLVYSLTKGALMTMTRNLGDALAPEGIRVNQVNPGWTLTQNERRLKEEEGLGDDWEANLSARYAPSGRILRPDEVAAHVIFWLSDAAGPVSGSVFEIEQHPFIGRNPDKALDSFRRRE